MFRKACKQLVWGVVGCMLMGMSGCAYGPVALRNARPEYNRVIHQTEKQELLLNIVRLRYGENVKLMQVASIVSTMNVSASAVGALSFPFGDLRSMSGMPNTASGSGVLNYSETPTITYVPVEGQQFANQILTAVPVSTLQVLLQSGWPIDWVLEMLIERMGPFVNLPEASTYSSFLELIKIWKQIQSRGDLSFVWIPQNDLVLADNLPASAVNTRVFNSNTPMQFLRYVQRPDGKYQLVQTPDSVVMEVRYANEAEAEQVSALLGAVSSRPKGELVERVSLSSAVVMPNDYTNRGAVTQLFVNLRSFQDILFSVSLGVEVPPEDTAFVWQGFVPPKPLVAVRHTGSQPAGALVAVPYRGHWFSVSDTDIRSKVRFGLLLTILSLQTTSGGAAPGLTLPVGR